MPFVLKNKVRLQVIAWVFLAILLSWMVSSTVFYLQVRSQMMAMREEQLSHPELYPNPIPEPRFDWSDLIIGPQGFFRRGEGRMNGPRNGNNNPPPPDGQRFGQPPPPRPGQQPGMDRPEDRPPVPPRQQMNAWLVFAARAGIALLFALFTGYIIGRRITKPLDKLTEGAHALREGKYDHRIEMTGEDEFTQVSRVMNDMAQQVQAHIVSVEEDSRRRRQILADVAHELRSPVMTISTMSDALTSGVANDDERRERALSAINTTAHRLRHLVSDLLELARLDLHELPIHRQQTDVRSLVDSWLAGYAHAAAEKGMILQAHLPEQAVLATLDPHRLTQVLDNILGNAISYAGEGSTVIVTLVDNNPFEIIIADDGHGIPAVHLPCIFDPFYRADTTRTPGNEHSGLGLRIARGLVEAQGGTLELTSEEGMGTTVVIELPR